MQLLSAWTGHAPRGIIGFGVVDKACWPIGDLCSLWVLQETEKMQFLGIRTPWTTAQELLVPVEGVTVVKSQYSVRVPYARDLLYEAPTHPSVAPLTLEYQREVCRYYEVTITVLLPALIPRRLTHDPVPFDNQVFNRLH